MLSQYADINGPVETSTSSEEDFYQPNVILKSAVMKESEPHQNELITYRLIMLVACLVFPAFGFLHVYVQGTSTDSMGLRLAVSIPTALILILSSKNGHVRRNILLYGSAVLYALTAASLLLLHWNDFAAERFAGMFLIFISASLFVKSRKQLIIYCILCIFAVASLSVLQSNLRGIHFVALMATWTAISYVSLNARLRIQDELRTTASILQTTFDSTSDGVLIMDETWMPLGCNRAFADMWRLPTSMSSASDMEGLIAKVLDQVEDRDAFQRAVDHLYPQPEICARHLIRMKDGRVIERHSQPRWVDGKPVGRVWVFRDITEQKQSEEALRESETRYRTLVESQIEAVCRWLPDTTLTFVNQAYCELMGRDREELLGRKWTEFVSDDLRLEVVQFYQSLIRNPRITTYEHDVEAANGKRYIQWTDCPIIDAEQNVVEFQSVGRDMTDHREIESTLLLQAGAMNEACDLIALTDADGLVTFTNRAFERETGYTSEEMIGKTLDVLRPQSGDVDDYDELVRCISSGMHWQGELRSRSKDGECFVTDVTVTPVRRSDGAVSNYIAIGRNITDRRDYEEKLDHQAHHDPLTGLPNRLHMTEHLTRLLCSGGHAVENLSLMLIDLDQFKIINDSLGHNVGDQLIVAVSDRLKSCVGESHLLARMGGDEFALALGELAQVEDARDVAMRILEELSHPFDIDGNRLVIGASIGVSVYPTDGTDADSLLKNADAAMFQVKECGRNGFRWYTEELYAANIARLDIERDLRLALERDELHVYYQPIVDLANNQLVGAEALLRWEHPQKGLISPGVFIPVAEETDLIVPIGDFVLREACAQSKRWQNLGYPPVVMAVNVSAHQLRRSEWMATTLGIIKETGIDHGYLNLELTESALTMDERNETDVLNQLKAMGVLISIDDFGTGYSSLGRLKHFPIIHIKIDGSFLRDITHTASDRALAESIVLMAHNLGIKVTAEWVESTEQMQVVQTIGCDYAQGYLISPPLPADAFEDFMRARGHASDDMRAA